MPADQTILWTSFVAASSLLFLVLLLVGGRKSRLDSRLGDLAGQAGSVAEPDTGAQFARGDLPKMAAPLIPHAEEDRARLQARLIRPGLYGRQAMPLFLGVKMLLMVAPVLLGIVAGSAGL